MEITNLSRTFDTGLPNAPSLKECAKVMLDPDELITFTTPDCSELDVVRKPFGFILSSLNARLPDHGFRPVLVVNEQPILKYWLFVVESGHEDEFHEYLTQWDYRIVGYLDMPGTLTLSDQL